MIRDRYWGLIRVSSAKQRIEGEGTKQQREMIEHFASARGITIYDFREIVESASITDRQKFNDFLTYCRNPENQVKGIIVKDISRFSRGGYRVYGEFKDSLTECGVKLIDTLGSITEPVNRLEYLDVTKYKWAYENPGRIGEVLQSEQAMTERFQLLQKLIGAEIISAREGYAVRPAIFGYKNKRTYTSTGLKRSVVVENEEEGLFVKKAFEMRASTAYSEVEIVETLNNLGFRTRKQDLRDKETKMITGQRGNCPMDGELLKKMIGNPRYAGVVCEEYTKFVAFKSPYLEPLVTIDTWNKANRGKKRIIEHENGTVEIVAGERAAKKVYLQNNPRFPFKDYIVCPECGQNPIASASRNKMGGHIGAYHCTRKHPRRSLNEKKAEEAIRNIIETTKVSEDFAEMFEEIVIDVWEKKQKETMDSAITVGEKALVKEKEIRALMDKIKMVSSPLVIKSLEDDIERLSEEKTSLRTERNESEFTEEHLREWIKYSRILMEHPLELFDRITNPLQKGIVFSLFLDVLPDFNQLLNGTPNLSCCFEVLKNQEVSKSQLVTLRRIELRLPG